MLLFIIVNIVVIGAVAAAIYENPGDKLPAFFFALVSLTFICGVTAMVLGNSFWHDVPVTHYEKPIPLENKVYIGNSPDKGTYVGWLETKGKGRLYRQVFNEDGKVILHTIDSDQKPKILVETIVWKCKSDHWIGTDLINDMRPDEYIYKIWVPKGSLQTVY